MKEARAFKVLLIGAVYLCVGVAGPAQGGEIFIESINGGRPASRGGVPLVAFPADAQAVGVMTTAVPSPLGGSLGFDPGLTHATVAAGGEAWDPAYAGDIYLPTLAGSSASFTISLPTNTLGFYFFMDTGPAAFYELVANEDGESGGVYAGQSVAGGWVFYTTDGGHISSINVMCYGDGGSGTQVQVGEFGIASAVPSILGVNATVVDGIYRPGASIPLTVTFSQPVTVTGSPSLALNSGGAALYASGSGSATLIFNYTVGLGEVATRLDYASSVALALNGGSIRATADAVLTLPSPGSPGSLGATRNLRILGLGTTYTVTTNSDSGDGSLRAAVIAAADGDSIQFSLSNQSLICLTSGPIVIDKTLTIAGPGPDALMLSGGSCGRILTLTGAADLVLSGLDLRYGLVNGDSGGGILLASGALQGNNLHFYTNSCTGSGGAIYAAAGTSLVLSNSSFRQNAGGQGGAVFSAGNSLLQGVTFLENAAVSGRNLGAGGGCEFSSGTNVLENCTFVLNYADGSYDGGGGGILAVGGRVILRHCTLTANLSSTAAGFVAANPWAGGTDVAVNPAASVYLENTLISGGWGQLGDRNDVSGAFESASRYNLLGDAGGSSGLIDQVNGNQCGPHSAPLNPVLSYWGAYVPSMAGFPLLPGSPAIDAGIASSVATDARGVPRPIGSAPDIGSFESHGYTLRTIAGEGQRIPIKVEIASPLIVQVTPNDASEPIEGGLVLFTAPTSGPSVTFPTNNVAISGGEAVTWAMANFEVGPYSVTAGGPGETSIPIYLTNTPPNAVGILMASPNPAMYGQTVTVTECVTNPATLPVPTGTVTISENSNSIVTLPLTTTGYAALASFTTNGFSVGWHGLFAQYSGDANIGSMTNMNGFQVQQTTPVLSGLSASAIAPGQPLSASTLTGNATNVWNGLPVSGTFGFDSPGFIPAEGYCLATGTFSPDSSNYVPAHFTVVVAVGSVSPAALDVTSSASNGEYRAGASIPVAITFSEPVVVTGTPQLALNSGGTAIFAGPSNSSVITFVYQVQPGDVAARLDYASTTALSLNGGTIRTLANNDMSLTLPAPGAPHSLGANKNLQIAGDGEIFVVTNTADSGPGSLRDAVAASQDQDQIQFQLAFPATITLTTGEIWLNHNLTITGPGPDQLKISGNNNSRIFEISGPGATITGLELRQGRAYNMNGGAVLVDSGLFTGSNLVFAENVALATFTGAGYGGALCVNGGASGLLETSTFDGNHAGGGGGAVVVEGGVSLTAVTFINNAASMDSNIGSGGALQLEGEGATLANCTFVNNQAMGTNDDGGGAIMVYGGPATIEQCTLVGNSAQTSDSYILSYPGSGGGGISIRFAYSGWVALVDTLVAGNTSAVTDRSDLSGAYVLWSHHNLIGDIGGSSGLVNGVNTNQCGSHLAPLNAMVGPLGNYGGLVETVPLLPGSPAIDAGVSIGWSTDARGFPRTAGAAPDIGAFEWQGSTPPQILAQPSSRTVALGATAAFSVTASSDAPMTFLWQLNNADLTETAPFTGTTTSNLTIAYASPTNAGYYRVIISNSAGAATSSAASLTVLGPDQTLCFGATTNQAVQLSQVLAPIQVSRFTNVGTFQFSVHWDPAVASYLGVEQFGLTGLGLENFGIAATNPSTLTVSWDDPSGMGQMLPDGTTAFAIRFELVGSPGAATAITIDGSPTPLEAGDGSLALIPVRAVPGQLTVSGPVALSGRIFYYPSSYPPTGPAGQAVAGVCVSLDGDVQTNILSAADGTYAFPDIGCGLGCSVCLVKTDDTPAVNGVSTLDIAVLRRHILDLAPLDSPYKLLAADVNGSASINTADISLMRRLILGLTNAFPAGLWRFVPADYIFPDCANPWAAPATRGYTNVAANLSGQDYVAIKLGDVNDSWTPSGGNPMVVAGGNASAPPSELCATDVRLVASQVLAAPGQRVGVSVNASGFAQCTTAQFSLGWDTNVLRFATVGSFGLPGCDTANFGTTLGTTGKLAFSWDDPAGTGLTGAGDRTLFVVYFDVIGGSGGSSPVHFADLPTPREVSLAMAQSPVATEDGQVVVTGAGPRISWTTNPAKGSVQVLVPTAVGPRYVLQFSQTLSGADWHDLSSVVGDGSVKALTDSPPQAGQSFYRVRVE